MKYQKIKITKIAIAGLLLFVVLGNTSIRKCEPGNKVVSQEFLNPLVFPATVPGSSDPIGDEWPMFHGALNHTGSTTTTPLIGTGFLWAYSSGGSVDSSPAVTGGRVYVGSDDDKVYCLDANTGALVWSYNTTSWVRSSPAVADGYVYVGSEYNMIYCFNATTGAIKWTYSTYFLESSLAIAGGCVYVASQFGTLLCLNAYTGVVIWSYNTWGGKSSPAIWAGRVYVGSYDNKTYCLNASTGAYIWNFTTGHCVESSPTIALGRVYVGSWDNKIYCLNATTGMYLWNYTTSKDVVVSPAFANGRIYVASDDGKLYCLNAITGTFVWSHFIGQFTRSSPAIANGRVYVGSYLGGVQCLDATSGRSLWNHTTMYSSLGVSSSPAIAGGRVYFGGSNSKIYCFPMILISVPSAPQNLQATAGDSQVVLTWETPANNGGTPITGYNIYRGDSSGANTLYVTIGNVTSYTDTNVKNGNNYSYKVTALNDAGEGMWLGEAYVTPVGPRVDGYPVGITIGFFAIACFLIVTQKKHTCKH